ncbi:Rrf2 family transcriptional regulator, partial [bacterium]|nr:Rrf2 family transcriptional regulator [candidate division CSSED10-310 bacterium]
EEEGLPRTYVEQLLLKLRRHNLIKSVRGARGGYLLSQPADKINARQIIEALEGQAFEILCERRARSRVKCIYDGTCVLNQVWVKLQKKINEVLDEVLLSDLIRGDSKCNP